MELREYDTAEASWQNFKELIRSIRRNVLVNEQGLPLDILEDDADAKAIHFCSQTRDGQVIGVIRMNLAGNIGRLAVDQGFRQQGIAHSLLEAALSKARRFGLAEVKLPALTSLDTFYRKAGFLPRGEKFVANALEHQEYYRSIEYKQLSRSVAQNKNPSPYALQDSAFQISAPGESTETEALHRLGDNNDLLILEGVEAFRQVIVEMCRQATHSLRILSPHLDHKLFDSVALQEICSALARRNRYTTIEILLYDSHRIVKNSHALLSLSRKLSSSIRMKLVHPELRQLQHEYVLVDGEGYSYRKDVEVYEGYAKFSDKTENNRLGRQFRDSWESGLFDPNLRQLKL